MKFLVRLSDKRRQLMTEELIRTHVDYLRQLKQKGVLPFCGPCKDGTAVMLFECGSVQEVTNYVEGDPFSKVNYYQTREIVEVQEADESNDFHLQQVLDSLTNTTQQS